LTSVSRWPYWRCLKHQTLDPDTVWIGEVGLGGEVRSVANLSMRLMETRPAGIQAPVILKASLPKGAGCDL